MTRKTPPLKPLTLVFALAILVLGCEINPSYPTASGGASVPSKQYAELTINKWTNGNIIHPDSGGKGEQWFKFIATSTTQRVYVKLSTTKYLAAYLYDSGFNRVGSELIVQGGTGAVRYASWSVKKGETYYVKASGYGFRVSSYDYYSGTYWIGFTEFPAQPETVITNLSENSWLNGNIVHPNSDGTGEQWFTFTATSSMQQVYIKLSSIKYLNAYLYDSSYNRIGSELIVQGGTDKLGSASWSVKAGENYYIQVSGYGFMVSFYDYYSGSYWIAFNSTGTPPTQQ